MKRYTTASPSHAKRSCWLSVLLSLAATPVPFVHAVHVDNAGGTVTLSGDAKQELAYGLDFERHSAWATLSDAAKTELAAAVGNSGVQYVRIPLLGDAERVEGTIEEAAYAQTLDLMGRIKAANPTLQFYATPRAIDPAVWGRHVLEPYTCYPLWVSIPDMERPMLPRFQPAKAADFLVRHVRFLESKGFKTAYLDLKDELRVKSPPALTEEMAKIIRLTLGKDAPRLVGPSGYNSELSAIWMRDASYQRGPEDFFLDVVSTHNTSERPKYRLDEFAAFAPFAERVGRPLWVSEMLGLEGPIKNQSACFAMVFGYMAKGAGGLCNFRSLGRADEPQKMFCAAADGSLVIDRLYHIYRQLATTSGGGRYVPVALSFDRAAGAAFVRGNQLAIWLANTIKYPKENILLDLGKWTLDGKMAKVIWWDSATGEEGSSAELEAAAGDHTVNVTLPGGAVAGYLFSLQQAVP